MAEVEHLADDVIVINAFMGAGLFGAIAVAGVGGVLSFIGAGLTVTAVALGLTTTDYGFLLSTGHVLRLIAASGFAGAAGAILGARIGAVVRNVGGAVTSAV